MPPPQHLTPWTSEWGWGGFPNGFLGENLTLAEADGCCGGSRSQRALVKPVCIRLSRGQKGPSLSPKVFPDPRMFTCETAPLLCQQLEGGSLPGLLFQDGSSCFRITRMCIFGAFDYRRHLGEPFHLRKGVLQVGRLRRRLVKAGRAHGMGPACPPPRCLASRGAGGQAVEAMRLQGRLLAAAPRDAFTVCLS